MADYRISSSCGFRREGIKSLLGAKRIATKEARLEVGGMICIYIKGIWGEWKTVAIKSSFTRSWSDVIEWTFPPPISKSKE